MTNRRNEDAPRDRLPHDMRESKGDRSTPGSHSLVTELLESPAAIQALSLALALIMEQAQQSSTGIRDHHGGGQSTHGDSLPHACAHTAPGHCSRT